jgi:soluble lytic murein transglycosylase-like protein
MRTLLLTAAALSAPHATKVRANQTVQFPSSSSAAISDTIIEGLLPSVSVRIDNFLAPVDARHAYDGLIAEAAEKYNLDPHMIRAVMQAESAFNAMAISPVGAVGLMQLMPDVAAELGADDPMDPRQNVMAGSRYLRQLLNAHRGNVKLALASYNAGPGNVAKYGGTPPFKETRNYVKKVTGLLADARANSND